MVVVVLNTSSINLLLLMLLLIAEDLKRARLQLREQHEHERERRRGEYSYYFNEVLCNNKRQWIAHKSLSSPRHGSDPFEMVHFYIFHSATAGSKQSNKD